MNGIYLGFWDKVLSAVWDAAAYLTYMAILGAILYGCVVSVFSLMSSTSDMAEVNFILLTLLGVIVFKHILDVNIAAYSVWSKRIRLDDGWDYF